MEVEKEAITKREAAKRQVETAILLFFNEKDYLSIHTLAAASLSILSDLSRPRSTALESTWDGIMERVRPQYRKQVWEAIREPMNFLKHADDDPEDILRFAPITNLALLVMCIESYDSLFGEMTTNMRIFRLWMMLNKPEGFINSPFDDPSWGKGLEMMRGLSRLAFFKEMLAAHGRMEG